MSGCSAVNCSNNRKKGFRLFRFPRDPHRCHVWAQNCRRDKWKPSLNSGICEAHFEESQYEQRRLDGWRKLKPNAVPTIFNLYIPPCLLVDRRESLCKKSSTTENSAANASPLGSNGRTDDNEGCEQAASLSSFDYREAERFERLEEKSRATAAAREEEGPSPAPLDAEVLSTLTHQGDQPKGKRKVPSSDVEPERTGFVGNPVIDCSQAIVVEVKGIETTSTQTGLTMVTLGALLRKSRELELRNAQLEKKVDKLEKFKKDEVVGKYRELQTTKKGSKKNLNNAQRRKKRGSRGLGA